MFDSENDVIHVAFCMTDNDGTYIRHVATTIASILSNTLSKIHFHLIHDLTLTQNNQKLLSTWIEQKGQYLSCYCLNNTQIREMKLLLQQNGYSCSVGTLYRLKLAEILPDIRKVIYVDSDVIVNLDLKILWEITIDSSFCGAILDHKSTRYKWSNRRAFRRMGIDYKRYFNAGILALNLEKIRNKMLLWKQAMGFFEKYRKDTIFFDQDALNNLLQKETIFLNERFNFIPVGEKGNVKEIEAIIHFAGPKPWNYRCSPYDWLYWKYFAMTPWGDTVEKLLDAQKDVGVDLGYGVMIGKISSKRRLFNAVKYRVLQ